MKSSLRTCFILGFCVLSACASTPDSKTDLPTAARPTESGRTIGIEARLQLQNKVQQKTFTVQLEAIAVEPSMMRLDLSGGFGSALGKFILRGDQVGILMPQQKKVYMGVASDRSFTPVLPIQLHPQDLLRFLFGEVPPNWKCENKSESEQICKDPLGQLTLTRDPRPESLNKSKWSVSSERYAMVFLPQSVQTKVQLKPDTFSMPVPDGYSKHKLP